MQQQVAEYLEMTAGSSSVSEYCCFLPLLTFVILTCRWFYVLGRVRNMICMILRAFCLFDLIDTWLCFLLEAARKSMKFAIAKKA